MFESEAYLSLRGFAPQLLILILARRQFRRTKANGRQERICVNRDSISLTYVEAKERYHITQPRLTRAYDELLEKGFVNVKHRGGAYQRDKADYELVDLWRFWKPGKECNHRERECVQRGFTKPKRTVSGQVRFQHTNP